MFYGRSETSHITVRDAAKMLRVSKWSLYRNMCDIPHIKVGSEYRIACWFLMMEPPPIHVFKQDFTQDAYYQPPLPFTVVPERRWRNGRRLVHLDPFGDAINPKQSFRND